MHWKRGNRFINITKEPPGLVRSRVPRTWTDKDLDKKFIWSSVKEFAAKNPGTPATNDIVVEYILADDDFTCNVSVDGTQAVTVKFAYSGDMENQIGDEVG